MEKVADLMVQIVYKQRSRLEAAQAFFAGCFAFVGFVILLPVFLGILAAYFLILTAVVGAFLSIFFTHVFNSF